MGEAHETSDGRAPVPSVRRGTVGSAEWDAVVDGEQRPFGGLGEELVWADKTDHVLACERGRAVAIGGLLEARVQAGGQTLLVAGIGGVIVHRAWRGRGLARALVQELLQIARERGLQRAMLFCTTGNVGLYQRLGFRPVGERVRAAQPGGEVLVPLEAMWRPLVADAAWPQGPVTLEGAPF